VQELVRARREDGLMRSKLAGQDQSATWAYGISLPPLAVEFFLLILSAAIIMGAPLAEAQTFQVLHAFSGGGDDGIQRPA